MALTTEGIDPRLFDISPLADFDDDQQTTIAVDLAVLPTHIGVLFNHYRTLEDVKRGEQRNVEAAIRQGIDPNTIEGVAFATPIAGSEHFAHQPYVDTGYLGTLWQGYTPAALPGSGMIHRDYSGLQNSCQSELAKNLVFSANVRDLEPRSFVPQDDNSCEHRSRSPAGTRDHTGGVGDKLLQEAPRPSSRSTGADGR